MAVDTMQKRASATLFMNPSQAKGVVPGGAVDQADRQDVIWAYRGILAASISDVYSGRGVGRGIGRGVFR